MDGSGLAGCIPSADQGYGPEGVRRSPQPCQSGAQPQRYFATGRLIEECFAKLGSYIKSCHAKDILLRKNLTVHLDEEPPGQGNLDYPAFLRGLSRLDANVPLMLEHLSNEEEYRAAAAYVRKVADQQGITL